MVEVSNNEYYSIKYNVGFKRMYKSEVLNENNIDYLYSEMMLFDHRTV